jgi:hypothetical protein
MISERAIQLVADAKIEQAYRDGKFDRLPGLGLPFEFDEMVCEPNWWLKRKAKSEEMKLPLPPVSASVQRYRDNMG